MIRITTFNTASTFGTDGVSDWVRSASTIADLCPDAVGCEEVTVHEDFKPDLDMPSLYGEYLKMTPVFGRATSRDGKGDYGVMALSKYPITRIDKLELPTPPGYEQRICLITKVEAPKTFFFLVTHFPPRNEFPGAKEARIRDIELITERVERDKLFPSVLCGDFNVEPGTPEIDFLHTLWDVCNDVCLDEYTHHSGLMLDYICTYPKGRVKLRDFQIGHQSVASDHRPVTAELEI